MSVGTESPRPVLTAPVKAALWMSGTAVSFAMMAWSIRELAAFVPAELVFLRSLVGIALLLPVLRLPLGTLVRPRHPVLYILRAVLSFGGMIAWFFALQHAVLADAVALQFTLPMFTIVFAIIVFKERVGIRRWLATIAGFAGALVIIRPGFATVDFSSVLVLASAALYAASNMFVKKLTESQSSQMILFYMHFMILPLGLVVALPYWAWPGWSDVPWIVLLAVSGSTAHYCYARALASAATSVVMPVDFLRLPLMALLGYVVYGQVASGWTWLGASVIFLATIYILRREARLAGAKARAAKTPVAEAGTLAGGRTGE